ncbi:MAG: T9SS type A sorting domain-containing protein [Melioribacteraceae bacterium]|nr:T9SS type A sorting domain-containing protein [Melioribacteraceae bacterium]
MKKINILLMMLFVTASLFAQTEFIVNTQLEENQRDPKIARDSEGNYVVVWKNEANDLGDISAQLFNLSDEKVGNEILVNTVLEEEQERPKVAMNKNGDFVVVWASHIKTESIFDIKARLFKNNEPIGEEFLVNTYLEGSQTKPDVDIDDEGNFIVVWESWFQDGSDKGVYAQRFNSNSDFLGEEFLVNTTKAYSQCRPTVKYFPNGNTLILWESWKQDVATESGYGIIAKILAPDGTVIKDEFTVNTYTNDYQWFGDIVINQDNSFVIAWCSWEQDGHDGGIYLQQFDSDGNKIESEILVNQNTEYYQWLPKITRMESGEYAVVWSSWQQDGSREGVYSRYYDSEFNRASFENKVNDFTEGYQWEPSIIPTNDNEIIVVWSSWNQADKKYEVVAKREKSEYPQGKIEEKTINHEEGNSTSIIKVHVIDSTFLTGDSYEASFTKDSGGDWFASIQNQRTGELKIDNLKLSLNPLAFNLTPVFDGIAVQFTLDNELKLDEEKSYFKTTSSTNVSFTIGQSSGQNVLAPVNMALIWGSADTLSDGKYSDPIYKAYNGSGQLVVDCPFILWNFDDNEKVDLFIQEINTNEKWDIEESINMLTPAKYQSTFPNFHGMLTPVYDENDIIMPSLGDTLFIYTVRPITANDKYVFSTEASNIVTSVLRDENIISHFKLGQNYPNPFNPATTIEYKVPNSGHVNLKVYNMLGELVTTLVNEVKTEGSYKQLFNAKSLASGVYFYTFEFQNKIISKKMMLIK